MDLADIDHTFLIRLQTDFPNLFEQAQKNNWIVCVPKAEALRGVQIDEEFVAAHLLRPSPTLKGIFVSTPCNNDHGPNFSCIIDENWSCLEVYSDCDSDGSGEPSPPDKIKIIGKDLWLFRNPSEHLTLVFLDSCIREKREIATHDSDESGFLQSLDLNPALFEELPPGIYSVKEADRFLGENLGNTVRAFLDPSVKSFLETVEITPQNLEHVAGIVKKDLIDFNVSRVLRALDATRVNIRNPGFLRCLNMAVECVALSRIHEAIFPVVCEKFGMEDRLLMERATEFCKLRITADQLGARIEFSVPLPATVVELASLDTFKTPLEKIQAFRNAVDYVIAEVKGALVEASSTIYTECDYTTPPITADDLLPLLTVVVMKVKPLHLAANVFYASVFSWSAEECGYALATVVAAKKFLQTVRPSKLRRSQTKLVQELSLAELILVTGEVDSRTAKKSESSKEIPDAVYEHQMGRVTSQIEASTRALSEEHVRSPQLSRSCTPSTTTTTNPIPTPKSPFLSPFTSRSSRVRFRISEVEPGS